MEEDKLGLPKFDGTNFAIWKFRVQLLLEERELADHIEKEPTASNLAQADWKAQDVKTRSLIVKCLTNDHVDCVRGKTTARQMWKSLLETYEKTGAVSEMFLRKKLLSLRFFDGESMEKHLACFDSIVTDLRAAGAEVRTAEAITYLLETLPRSYDSVATALMTIEPEKLTVAKVKASLLNEYVKKKERDGDGQEETKPAVFLGKADRRRKPFPGQCWKCKQTGHKAYECQATEATAGSSRESGEEVTRNLPTKKKAFQLRRPDVADGEDPVTRGGFAFLAKKMKLKKKAGMEVTWIIDSGCTDHMVNDDSLFLAEQTLRNSYPVSLAEEGQAIVATKVGFISGTSYVKEREYLCEISDVLYAPGLRHNLLSVSRLEKAGFAVVFRNGVVQLLDGNTIFAVGKRSHDLYELSFTLNRAEANSVQASVHKNTLWHRRLAHLGMKSVRDLARLKMAKGIDSSITDSAELCEACIMGKHSRPPFRTRESRASRPLERVHTDVCGPITPATWDGKRYFVTFIDDCTHFTVIYLIASRDEVLPRFKEYKAMVEAGFNLPLSKLRCDNGGEYVSNEFKSFCRDSGVVVEYTMAYTPEQNGEAERMNRTIVEKGRAMIYESGLPKEMWGEAVMCALYVTNRSPTRALKANVTPAEEWYGEKPDLSVLRVFGCKAFAHIPKHKRGKFDPKSHECIMLGYDTNGYRLWDPIAKKVVLSRDVIFKEDEFPAIQDQGEGGSEDRVFAEESCDVGGCESVPTDEEPEEEEEEVSDDSDSTVEEPVREMEEEVSASSDDEFFDLENPEQEDGVHETEVVIVEPEVSAAAGEGEEANVEQDPLERHGRTRRPPLWHQDYDMASSAFLAEGFQDDVPISYADIKGRSDESCWMRAIEEELASLKANDTWEVVQSSAGKKVISSKWVFKRKLDKDGNPDRYKARLVARGFLQTHGVDYQETYAPVAKLATIRFLLAIGIQRGFHFCHMDVVTAFLHGNLEQPVYMRAPDGVDAANGAVLKLKRSLYGLKQSPKCWNDRFHRYVISIGFVQSEADYCLYVKEDAAGLLYLLLYVDDLMICGSNLETIENLKVMLSSEFRMKDLGCVEHFMGMRIEIDRDRGRVAINQAVFAESILERFGMQSCNSVSTPIEPSTKLRRPEGTKSADSRYRQLIGSLMYLMLGSRPDLCFAVSYFSRFQDCAGEQHMNHLKRVLRYLRGTASYELVYTRNPDAVPLKGYADADWANDLDDRRSTSGFLFQVYGNIVSWATRKQGVVAQSTTEAEYIAAANAVSEALWFKKMFEDILAPIRHPIPIQEDNQGCLFVAKNPETKRTKHVDVKYHLVREKVWNKEVVLEYVPSENQAADILTKALPRGAFEKFRDVLGLERGGV